MKRFEFKKKFIESELPPKNTDVYWIDTNENSTAKDILSIKEYVNGEWKNICGSNSNDSNTGYDNFIKLDEGCYLLKTSNVQVVPNDTIRSLQIYQRTIEGNNPHLGLFSWKDLYENYDNYYTTALSSLKIKGIIDDAKILSNFNNSYKSKYYLFVQYFDKLLDNIEFPENVNVSNITDLEPYLKEVEPLLNFKTSYLKLNSDSQNKVGDCKIIVYCEEQKTVNEFDFQIDLSEDERLIISRVFNDAYNFKSSLDYVVISTESLANDDETEIVEHIVKNDIGKDICENQCVYNTSTKKIDVTRFDLNGWGNNTDKPVPMQYWIDSYDDTKKPEIGLYYRCTPTESPTEISNYFKSHGGVSLVDLIVTKLYLPKYNKCFYLINDKTNTVIKVGLGEFKECDISTKFDANW